MSFKKVRGAVIFLISVSILAPSLIQLQEVDGDGCFIPIKYEEVFEPGQNAIIAWNGTHEKMVLSVDIHGEEGSEGFHLIPFPSEPKVTLGNKTVFTNLTREINQKDAGYPLGGYQSDGGYGGAGGNSSGYQILFHDLLGDHNVTVIRVTDFEAFKLKINSFLSDMGITIERWPDGMENVIESYTGRGCNYFSVDRYEITNKTSSIEPLVFEFETEEAYFPLEISSPMKGVSDLNLAFFIPQDIKFNISGLNNGIEVSKQYIFDHYDVEDVGSPVYDLFPEGALFILFEGSVDLPDLKGDLLIRQYHGESWMEWGAVYRCTQILKMGDDDFDRLLKYNMYPNTDSDGLYCIDPATYEILWDLPVSGQNMSVMNRLVISEDLDGRPGDEIIVIDSTYYGLEILRISPTTGKILWKSLFEQRTPRYPYYSFGTSFDPIRMNGPDGEDHLFLKGVNILLNLNNGSIHSQLVNEHLKDLEYDQVSAFPMETGDLLLGRLRYGGMVLLDPWNENDTTRIYSIGHINRRLPITYQNKTYLFLNGRYNGSGGNLIIDPLNGTIVNEWSKDDSLYWVWFGEGDLDNDGDTEMLFYERNYQNKKNEYRITCRNAATGDREWFVDVSYPWSSIPNWHKMIDLDLNEDGISEVLVYTDKGYLSLISGSNGYEILKDDYNYIAHGIDWNGNGIQDIVMADDENTYVYDPTLNSILGTYSRPFIPEWTTFIGTLDLNRDGSKEIYVHSSGKGYYLERGASDWRKMVPDHDTDDWYQLGDRILHDGADRKIYSKNELIEISKEDQLGFFTNSTKAHINRSITITVDLLHLQDELNISKVEIGSSLEGSIFSDWKEIVPHRYECRWFPKVDKATLASIWIKAPITEKVVLTRSKMIDVITDRETEKRSPFKVSFEADREAILPGEQVTFTVCTSIEIPGSIIDVSMIEIDDFGNRIIISVLDDSTWKFYWRAPYQIGTASWILRVSVNGSVVHEELASITVVKPSVLYEPFIELTLTEFHHNIEPGDPVQFIVSVRGVQEFSLDSLMIQYTGEAGGELTELFEISEGNWLFYYTPLKPGDVTITASYYLGKEDPLSHSIVLNIVGDASKIEPVIEDPEGTVDDQEEEIEPGHDEVNITEREPDQTSKGQDSVDLTDVFVFLTIVLSILAILLMMIIMIFVKRENKNYNE